MRVILNRFLGRLGSVYRTGPPLDSRIPSQKDLVALEGQRVIPPTEEKFYPAIESLRWREQHLSAKMLTQG